MSEKEKYVNDPEPAEMKWHAVCELFPMMSDDELARLAEDIKANGLKEPITVMPDGKGLDGRNRHKACKLASVLPKFKTYEGNDPVGFVVSKNLHRRHLTTIQRASIAAEIANLPRGGDRGNQHTGGKELNKSMATAPITSTKLPR
jgi:hypothetical protein